MIELTHITCPRCGNIKATVDPQENNTFACTINCEKCGYIRNSESFTINGPEDGPVANRFMKTFTSLLANMTKMGKYTIEVNTVYVGDKITHTIEVTKTAPQEKT